VRDDRLFGRSAPLAAMFYYSRDGFGEYAGIFNPMPMAVTQICTRPIAGRHCVDQGSLFFSTILQAVLPPDAFRVQSRLTGVK
jgi:hypothetical protein